MNDVHAVEDERVLILEELQELLARINRAKRATPIEAERDAYFAASLLVLGAIERLER